MPPDHQSPLGRALRRAEIPECGCKPKILHDPDCPYQDREHAAPCDCRYGFKGGACPHIAAHKPTLAGKKGRPPRPLTFEDLARLVKAFDPDGHDEPPPPRAPAVAEDAETLLQLRIVRRAEGVGLRHPDDVLPGQVDTVGIQARAGLKQDGTRTPRLTFLERQLLEKLEREVEPAFLMWPWKRAGARSLPAAARALREIESRQLWREAATSFKLYAADRWLFMPADLETIFGAAAEAPASLPARRAA